MSSIASIFSEMTAAHAELRAAQAAADLALELAFERFLSEAKACLDDLVCETEKGMI